MAASNDLLTALGPSSGLINDQLVPTADMAAIMPLAASFVIPGAGAAVSTLPGGTGGAAGSGGAGDVTSEGVPHSGAGSGSGTVLGLPALVFWVLLALLAGYIFIWQVHFK